MDTQLQEIGARLKKARLARHMTQAQLAEAAGISVSFLSNIEMGRQAMNVKILTAILNALNVSADWLLNTETDSSSHAVAEEIERELSSCTPKEREAILQLVQIMKKSIASLKLSMDD